MTRSYHICEGKREKLVREIFSKTTSLNNRSRKQTICGTHFPEMIYCLKTISENWLSSESFSEHRFRMISKSVSCYGYVINIQSAQIHIDIFMHLVNTHQTVHTRKYTSMYARTHMYIDMYIYVYMYVYIYIYLYVDVHICISPGISGRRCPGWFRSTAQWLSRWVWL